MPLGSLLGPLEALLGGLKSEKNADSPTRKPVFVNAVFWFFEAPNGPLGLILVPFGWIWSQTWVPNGLTSLVKSDQKVGSLFDQKSDHFRVPERVPKNPRIEIAGLRHFLPASRFCLLFFLVFL